MKPNKRNIHSRRIYNPFHVNANDAWILKLLFLPILFHGVPIGVAQNGASSNDTTDSGTDFDPKMAILMIVLVSAFFLLGFFSVYIRQCAGRALGLDTGQPVDPGAWLNLRASRGLDPSIIESFPTFLYSTVKDLRIGKEALECAVCLNEFEDHETLRLIPKCSHVFHPGCIDAWLQFHSTCPLCRANLVPKPGEPVSFHVPVPDTELAHEPDLQRDNDPSDHRRRVLDSPEVRLINSVTLTNQNRPPRSRSTGWKLTGLFSRSSSTGDSLVQAGANLERFTLRIPEEAQSRLVNSNLNRSKSHVALSEARSSRRGYRSGSVGSERNYFYNKERLDQDGRFDRRPFSITPPYRTGSLRSPSVGNHGTGGDDVCAGPPKGLLQTLRTPLDRLFLGKDNVGERSSDRLGRESQV